MDVVDDQVGSPTYVGDLAAAVLEVADGSRAVRGRVLHAANEGAVSRFEQARAVFEECGADPQRVRPVSTAQYPPRPAPRPPTPRYPAGSPPRRACIPLDPGARTAAW